MMKQKIQITIFSCQNYSYSNINTYYHAFDISRPKIWRIVSLNDLIYLILSSNLRKFVFEYLYLYQIFINYFLLLFWTINQNDHHLSKGCKKSIFRFKIVVCMHGWWWLSGYFELYSNDGECRLSNKLAVVGL